MDSNYGQCRDILGKGEFMEAFLKVDKVYLTRVEKIIIYIISKHGLWLYYSVVWLYFKVKNRMIKKDCL